MKTADGELGDLAAKIVTCRRCGLAGGRTLAVPGEGPVGARVMLIGEAPGRLEDLSGRPFVGPSGRLLDVLLAEAGLTREQCFITSIVKCRPPNNRDPEAAEVLACAGHLAAQIAAIEPQIICLLGRPAVCAVLGLTAPMSVLHGIPITRDGVLYLPLYHPAAALHRASLRPTLVEDMRRLRQLLVAGPTTAPSQVP